ncbi:conserved hypothetical protein [Ricinus communis]|uniref:Uncharacterized protein n=1 Tax=Ricinus communis TaxID=3988 RepID=B9RL16_RICCO|nr:conserved hypothetical protein [Ricinus communis]
MYISARDHILSCTKGWTRAITSNCTINAANTHGEVPTEDENRGAKESFLGEDNHCTINSNVIGVAGSTNL